MSNDYTIAAVVRALGILKLFDEKHKRMTLTEISERSGVTKSSVLRVLASCEAQGFIKYEPETKMYRLGIEIFKLSNTAYDFLGFKKTAVPFVQKMVNEMDLVGHLGVIENDHAVVIAKVWPNNATDGLAMLSRVGGIVPTHCTGIGKVLTAFGTDEERKRLLDNCNFERYTDETICSRAEFEKVIDTIRKQGYAVTISEHEPFIECITYPVYGINNRLVGAMSLSGLTHAFDAEMEARAKSILHRTAQLVSNEMGA